MISWYGHPTPKPVSEVPETKKRLPIEEPTYLNDELQANLSQEAVVAVAGAGPAEEGTGAPVEEKPKAKSAPKSKPKSKPNSTKGEE